jgi:hypothetical protein
VSLEQRLDGGLLIAHDGRRWRNDLFHVWFWCVWD